jgi:tetratricopeptide (TPR) repeat protein
MAEVFTTMGEPAMVDYANGMVSYSMDEYDQALELLKKAEAAKQDSQAIYLGLGFTYEALGELENAKAAYEKTLTVGPSNFSAVTGIQRIDLLLSNQ